MKKREDPLALEYPGFVTKKVEASPNFDASNEKKWIKSTKLIIEAKPEKEGKNKFYRDQDNSLMLPSITGRKLQSVKEWIFLVLI